MKNNVRPDPNTVHLIKGYNKELCKRFDDELIELRLRWWDKSIDKINGLIPFSCPVGYNLV